MATVPSSGRINFTDIQTVVSGTGPVWLSQMAPLVGLYKNDIVTVGAFAGKMNASRAGLLYRAFAGYFADDTTWFDARTETNSGLTSNFTSLSTSTGGIYTNTGSSTTFSVEWFGYFYAPTTGSYTFYTNSDDASYLWIGAAALSGYTAANCLVNNSGLHGVQDRSGSITLTGPGYYPIRMQYGQNTSGYDFTASFSGPGITRTYDCTGYVYYGLGAYSTLLANSARLIRTVTSTNTDGTYYINVNGTSIPTYCLMNSKWDGGGWMMMMKATRGTTFSFTSTYWTDNSTTLNATDMTRADADAKYNIMNYGMVKDVMALWPDVGTTGGSISQTEAWSWLVNNYYSSGTRCTAMTGFAAANSRDSPSYSDPTTFPGFSSSIWSTQTPSKRHVFGGGSHLSANVKTRWGFLFNENSLNDFTSIDVTGGIGIDHGSYSAGDFISCCQSTTGLNRSMRVELYGR